MVGKRAGGLQGEKMDVDRCEMFKARYVHEVERTETGAKEEQAVHANLLRRREGCWSGEVGITCGQKSLWTSN